jgi:RNA polymerase sigma-70 factor (ECF subfamily)
LKVFFSKSARDRDSRRVIEIPEFVSSNLEEPSDSRLSRIETLWSVVRQAHDAEDAMSLTAQQRLLDIYGGAIKRYLLASLRDADLADELFQQFALKFVKGDFRSVDPSKGKFRFFVKTVVYNLINQHHRKKAVRKERPLVEEQAENPGGDDSNHDDRLFLASWRDDLLEQTWEAMAEHEAKTGVPYNSVLRLRVSQPTLSSEEFAERLSAELGKPISSATARVNLHRAREKFANLLIVVISGSLEDPSRETIESELIDLGLIDYCREALDSYPTGS